MAQHKKMTSRERILAAYAREAVDHPPVCPNLIRWIRGHHGCACEMHQLQVMEKYRFDPLIEYGKYLNDPICSDYVYRPDAAGGYRDLPGVTAELRVENHHDRTIHIRSFDTPDGVLTDRIDWPRPNVGYGDGPNPHRVEPLLKSTQDLAALRHLYPQPKTGFTEDLRFFTEMVGQRGLVEYFEASNAGSWGMESLGPENMLLCAAENPELLKGALRICQEQHLRNLKVVLESGHMHHAVSWFQCGPSVGWSPPHIREFFFPLIREGVELVHSYGGTYRFQDDGKMRQAIGELIEMGVDVIGALQPPDTGDCMIGEIKRTYDGQACFLGGLDPTYTFELGSSEKVRQAATDYLDQIGDGKGVVIATAEAFGPETPEQCLYEWTRTVSEYWPSRCSSRP